MRTMVAVFALAFAGASIAGSDRPVQHPEHEIAFTAASRSGLRNAGAAGSSRGAGASACLAGGSIAT